VPIDESEIRLEVMDSIHSIPAAAWNCMTGDHNPFVEHGFLSALEEGGCLGQHSGWIARYLALYHVPTERWIGAAPLFAKTNSYGEYIFDWAWADGARRAGLAYYPKLTVAVPFTPATGPRILAAPDVDFARVAELLGRGARALAAQIGAHSVHWLFCSETEQNLLEGCGYVKRSSLQFHWNNQGYRDFDDFLSALRSRRRKEVRRERSKVVGHNLSIEVCTGDALSDEDWHALQRFYRNTIDERGAIPYLTPGFFDAIACGFAHRVVVAMARRRGQAVAGTLCFRKGSHLYGRYWGCSETLDSLHFELCYYRLIEYAIEHRLDLFEAGAQGVHKLARGFLPTQTRSAHWIAHPGLAGAIYDYLEREHGQVAAEIAWLSERSPFRVA